MKKIHVVLLTGCVFATLFFLFFGKEDLPPADLARTASFRQALSEGRRVVICAFGDSITAGVNAPYGYLDRVVERLRREYPRSVIEAVNAGVPGDTAEDGLKRVQTDVIRKDPDLVWVEFGWNDFKNGVSAADFERALSEIIGRIRSETGAVIYLMTTTQVDVVLANWKIQARNEIIQKVADRSDCGLIDVYRHFSLARKRGESLKDLMSADRIHPSGKGQDLIARAVLREILPPTVR